MAEVKYESYTISGGTRDGQIATGVIIRPHETAGGQAEMEALDYVKFHMNIDVDKPLSSNEGAIDFHILYIWKDANKASGEHIAKYYLSMPTQGETGQTTVTFGYTNRNRSATTFQGTGLTMSLTFPVDKTKWWKMRTFYWTIVPYELVGTSANPLSREGNEGITHVPATWTFDGTETQVEIEDFRWRGDGGTPRVSMNIKKRNDHSVNDSVDRRYIFDPQMKAMFAYEFEETVYRVNGTDSYDSNNNNSANSGNRITFNDNANGSGFRQEIGTNHTPTSTTITDERNITDIVHSFWFNHMFSINIKAKDRKGNVIQSVTRTESFGGRQYSDNHDYDHTDTLAFSNPVAGGRPRLTVQVKASTSPAYAAYHRVEIRHTANGDVKQSFSFNGFNANGILQDFGSSEKFGSIDLNSAAIPDTYKDQDLHITVRSKTNTHSPNMNANTGGSIDTHSFTHKYVSQKWDSWDNSTHQQVVKVTANELNIKVKPKSGASNGTSRAWGFQVKVVNPADDGFVVFEGLDRGEEKFIEQKHNGDPINIINLLSGNVLPGQIGGQAYRNHITVTVEYRARYASATYLLGGGTHQEQLVVPTQPKAEITSIGIATEGNVKKYSANGGGVVKINYRLRAHSILEGVNCFPNKVRVRGGYYDSSNIFTYQGGDWDQIVALNPTTITSGLLPFSGNTTTHEGAIEIKINDFNRQLHHSNQKGKIGFVIIPLDIDDNEYPQGTSDNKKFTLLNPFSFVPELAGHYMVNNSEGIKIRINNIKEVAGTHEPATIKIFVFADHGDVNNKQIDIPYSDISKNTDNRVHLLSQSGTDTSEDYHGLMSIDHYAGGSVLTTNQRINLRNLGNEGYIQVQALDYEGKLFAGGPNNAWKNVTPSISAQPEFGENVLFPTFEQWDWHLFIDDNEENVGYIRVFLEQFNENMRNWWRTGSEMGLQIQEAELNFYTANDYGFIPHDPEKPAESAATRNTDAGNIIYDEWFSLGDLEGGSTNNELGRQIRIARKFINPEDLGKADFSNVWRNFRGRLKFFIERSGKTYYSEWVNLYHMWKLNKHRHPSGGTKGLGAAKSYFTHQAGHVFNNRTSQMGDGTLHIKIDPDSPSDAQRGRLTSGMWGYTLGGKVTEDVVESVVNQDGTLISAGQQNSNRSNASKTTELIYAPGEPEDNFHTIFGSEDGEIQGTDAIDYAGVLTNEAMYKSEIKLIVDRKSNNDRRGTSGSINAPDDSSAREDYNSNKSSNVLQYPSSGWNLSNVRAEFKKTLTFTQQVFMNDLSLHENRLLVPDAKSVKFIQNHDGAYHFSRRTIEIGLPFNVDSYFVNVNPKVGVGLRIQHFQPGKAPNTSIPTAFTQNFVCFKPTFDASGNIAKWEESNGGVKQANSTNLTWENNSFASADLSTFRDEFLFDLRNHMEKTGENENSKYSIPVELTFLHSMYGYQDNAFDASRNIFFILYFYTEEEITKSAKGGTGGINTPFTPAGTVTQADITNPQTWMSRNVSYRQSHTSEDNINNPTNLQNETSQYGHIEGSTEGKVDPSHATFNSWTLVENNNTKTVIDGKLDFTNLDTKKMPWFGAVDKVIYNFHGRHTNADLGLDASKMEDPNVTVSFGNTVKPKQLDTVNYVVEEDVSFYIDPQVTSETDFGADGRVYSKYLTFPSNLITAPQRQLDKNYKEDFVPDFTNLAFTSGEEVNVTTPDGEQNTPSHRLSFKYNSTAFTDAEDYFQVAHENIKIMRTLEQDGIEYGTENWSKVYDGNIFDIANKTDNGDGSHTFIVDDNSIDVAAIGGNFNPENIFVYKYRIFPSLKYTPGGAGQTEKSFERIMDPEILATLDSTGPLNLFEPVSIEEVNYLDRHSIEVHWKYIHNDTLNTIKGFNEDPDRTLAVKFKVYYKAAVEKDFVYRNDIKETRPNIFERTIPKVQKEKIKFDSMTSEWIYSGFELFDLDTDSEQKFYHNIEYDKLSFEYGVKIAVLVTVEDSNNEPEVISLNHEIAQVENVRGTNTYGMTQFEDTGFLVAPPEHLKIRKKYSDIELAGINDILARRKYEYDLLADNIHQIPFSVTRKRAKTRLSDKPYISST